MEHEGRGIASALLACLEAAARRQGLARLFTEASITAKPFFERRGFKVLSWLLPIVHYRGNVTPMAIAQSKVTAQGQISVPAEVRKKLGVGPGSILEWDEHGDGVVVRRAGRYSSEDVHLALFPEKVSKKGRPEVKDAIRKYMRKKHARS